MSDDLMIKCDNVVFEYTAQDQNTSDPDAQYDGDVQLSRVRAVDGVSFNVKKGEFVAIIGKNGSGKTTLAKCLNALFLPTSGDVIVNGWNTKDEQNLWNIRQAAGMVFQNPDNQLVSSIVEDDVAFGPENLGLPSEVIRERVETSLKLVGMSYAAKRAPHMLSGGQKQRVAIAGVIAMKPECIIFDEPTAMLDPKGRKEVMDIIRSLLSEGITVILITHFMDEAVSADRIIVMDKGRIIKEGIPQEIFTDKELIRSFEADLPCGVELAIRLREGGLDVPEYIVTDEELADYLSGLDKEESSEGGSEVKQEEPGR